MTSVAALILMTLLSGEDESKQRGRFHELRNRLGIRPDESKLHPRLQGILDQYGTKVLRQVMAILRLQGLQDHIDKVGKILPWVARVISNEQVLARQQEQLFDVLPQSVTLPGDWPRLDVISVWQEALRADLGQLDLDAVSRAVRDWDHDLNERADVVFVEQNLQSGTYAHERAYQFVPWIKYRLAMGDRGPWPELLWLFDWIQAEEVTPAELLSLSSSTAARRSAVWHGQGDVSEAAEDTWNAWHDRVEEAKVQGWLPPAGRIIQRWPNGYTLHSLEDTFSQLKAESKIMDHCVGRGDYGTGYWRAIQYGRSQIWSLRNAEGFPVATFEVGLDHHKKPKDFPQIYAPKNTPVHPAHLAYVFDVVGPHLANIPNYLQDKFLVYVTGRHHPGFHWILESPRLALKWAKREGPADDTRLAVSESGPGNALAYALEVDGIAHPITFKAVLPSSDGRHITSYAQNLGVNMDSPDTRRLLLEAVPMASLRWAGAEGPRMDTRERASEDPVLAVAYAAEIDKYQHPLTQISAYRTPLTALAYDKHFEVPTEEGREMASQRAQTAMFYAKEVDQGIHPVTLQGVLTAPVETDNKQLKDYFTEYQDHSFRSPFQFSAKEREGDPYAIKDRARLLELYPRVLGSLQAPVHGTAFSMEMVSEDDAPELLQETGDRTDLGDTPIRITFFLAAPEHYSPYYDLWINDLQFVRKAYDLLLGFVVGGLDIPDQQADELVNKIRDNKFIIVSELRRRLEEMKGERVSASKMQRLHPEVEEKLLDIGEKSPLVLGRIGSQYPDLMKRAGTEHIWTHHDALPVILGGRYSTVGGQQELFRIFKEDPKWRRRAVKGPAAALLIAKQLDRGPRADTLNRVIKDGTPAQLKIYLTEVIGDLSQLPTKVRMALSTKGIDLHREMGFTKFYARGGGGYQGGRTDYVDEISTKVLGQAVAFAFRDLSRRYRRKTRAERAELAKAMEGARKWVERGNCTEPPTAFMDIAQRYYPSFLTWLQKDFWDGYDGISPAKPLGATTEGKKLPKVVFVGQLGRCGDDRYIQAPAIPSSDSAGIMLRGGLQAEGPGGDHIWQWWQSLIPREQRLVANRLWEDVDWRTVTRDDLMGGLAVIWGGATPIDAELWYDTDIVHEVNVMDTGLLWAIPWETPSREVGWMLIYPSHDAQIGPKARIGGMYRVGTQSEGY